MVLCLAEKSVRLVFQRSEPGLQLTCVEVLGLHESAIGLQEMSTVADQITSGRGFYHRL